MGRYNLSAQKVHQHATRLLQVAHTKTPPSWYNVIGSVPSSEVLTRRPMQPQSSTKKRKASRLFAPVQLEHREDNLRWEFFNDHPWELARPRVVLEQDGKDAEKWDWSHSFARPRYAPADVESAVRVEAWEAKQKEQICRPVNGEGVVQRQQWLMDNEGLSQSAAYDKARKEFYQERHRQEIEQRVAREEALFQGAVFGMSAIEVGMMLEDKAYENFRAMASSEVMLQNASQNRDTDNDEDDANLASNLGEVIDSIPGSRAGQDALGGAAIHP